MVNGGGWGVVRGVVSGVVCWGEGVCWGVLQRRGGGEEWVGGDVGGDVGGGVGTTVLVDRSEERGRGKGEGSRVATEFKGRGEVDSPQLDNDEQDIPEVASGSRGSDLTRAIVVIVYNGCRM